VFTKFDLEHKNNYWMSLRSWWRIPEDAKLTPDAPEGDDNPDITRFYGHHELRFGYSSSGLNWNVMLRRSLRSSGKGAAELNLSYPTGFNPKTRWFIRAFDGYGESLIDYNRRVRRLGIGIMLNDWY
jgi:phospholipase A1